MAGRWGSPGAVLLVERGDLSDERKRKILTDNPARLFGIPVPYWAPLFVCCRVVCVVFIGYM